MRTLVFHPTPSRWPADIRSEAMDTAQYFANRTRQRVTVFWRNTGRNGAQFFLRLPGQTAPPFAPWSTWFDPDKDSKQNSFSALAR